MHKIVNNLLSIQNGIKLKIKELSLKDCNPKAIVDIQVENKLVICDWENDKPIYEDEWLEVDDVQQDDNKEFVSIIT